MSKESNKTNNKSKISKDKYDKNEEEKV